MLLNTSRQKERASLQSDVSVSAVFAGSGISGTAQNEKKSQESKSVSKMAKDDNIDAIIKAYEQALSIEKAMEKEQFQMEDEEMAPKALRGKKRNKKVEDTARGEKRLEDETEAESREVKHEKRLEDETEEESRGVKHAQWLSMFGVKLRMERLRKPEPDLLLEAAEMVAQNHLRDRVTLPADPDDATKSLSREIAQSGGWLAPVSCAFLGCNWNAPATSIKSQYEDDPEHPWDQHLRAHIASDHSHAIYEQACKIVGPEKAAQCSWDIYKEALSVKERNSIPVAGVSIERRVCEATAHVYNDACVRALICFACARVKVDTGRIRSEIKFMSGKWLFSLPPGSLVKNFSMAEFSRRYCKSGTPLAEKRSRPGSYDGPDFSDWKLNLHAQYWQLLQDNVDCKEITFEDSAIQFSKFVQHRFRNIFKFRRMSF